MARIFLIEDDRDLREAVGYSLGKAGHEVTAAESGAKGLRSVAKTRPDLIVLDLILPDLSGFEVCRMIKDSNAGRHTPVIILTARGSEEDRIAGFEAGADDYVVKPFSMRELTLRIAVALRHPTAAQRQSQHVRVGDIAIDRSAMRAQRDGKPVKLAPVELRLLLALADRRGLLCTRGLLLSTVWGRPQDTDTRTVDTHIKRLRQKLGTSGSKIETVRGAGYRLAQEAEEDANGRE